MQEEWRDIVIEKNGIIYDYTGLYQVSNLGRVKKLTNSKSCKEKMLKPGISGGRAQVTLSKNNKQKQFKVHRLVANAFIPNPDNLPVINHIDENPLNNCVINLEWCSQKYNAQYSYNLHKKERYEKCIEAGKKGKGSKRKPFTKEHKQKLSKAKKGKHLTEEHKQKLSNKTRDENNPRARAVICLETLQVFNTIKEAKQWSGCSAIVAQINGRCKSSGKHPETGEKLHWMYYEDWLKLQENKREDDIL